MKKKFKILLKTITICICLLFSASFFSACANDGTKSQAYTITGYIYDEFGSAVEGVTVSSDFGSSTTDKDGKYTFSGIEGSVVLSPSKSGYQFAEVSKYVKNASDDANFVAYKEYTVSGTAHNNSVAVPNANIKLSSLAGEFYTMTDEFGNFTVSGVAGRTTISCEVDGVEFYSTSASFDAPTVSINTTSSLTIDVESDDELDFTKVELWLDGSKLLFADSHKVIENVKCGSLVELKSSYYHFDKPATFVVDELNQVESFNLNRIYSLSGVAVSGETPLESANIFVDGKLASTTTATGNFVLDGLWGERLISANFAGFEFNTELVDFEDSSITFRGSKTITLEFVLDFAGEEDFLVSNQANTIIDDGIFEIEKVYLGETIYLTSFNYHLDVNTVVVGDSNHYKVPAQKYYALEVQGIEGVGAGVLVDGESLSPSLQSKLYGEHTITGTYSNYIFSSDVVNAGKPIATLTYKVPYSVEFTVSTGELMLAGARVTVGENYAVTSALGVATLNNVFIGDKIQITKTGYNSAVYEFAGESTIGVGLTFNISGVVKTGDEAVEQVEVAVGEIKTTTNENGFFEIKNLEGNVTIVASKEGFVFENKTTNIGSTEIAFSGTYTVSGKIETETQKVYKIKIINTSTGAETVFDVDANGNFEIANLSGQVMIFAIDASENIDLNPASYTVAGASSCNFSSGGCSVEGYVLTGDKPVAYAKVTAGAVSVYTDANGKYRFELLTSACEISVSKTGYVFSNNISISEVTEDIENANFTATYSVLGRTLFGTETLRGVDVYFVGDDEPAAVTDSNGEFVIFGISGEATLEFRKSGYAFASTIAVSGYKTDIEASAQIVASISVMSGAIEIEDVDYFVNGTKAGTIDGSQISLTLSKGDVVSFEKDGFAISSVTISNTNTYTASASYSVSATVVSGAENITGFEVKLNGEVTRNLVISGNTFTISGLVGQNELLVQKAGYVFEAVEVSSYESVIFAGTYTISGTAFVGTNPLAGVVVTAGAKQCTTDENGAYSISGLSGKVSVSASKTGYGFESYANKIGEQVLTFDASYTLSGTVKTGDVVIALADVCVVIEGSSTQYTAKTNSEGAFTISGIKGNANIIVSKDGYNSATLEGFADYTQNIECSLTYSYLIRFDFTALSGAVENVTVYLNGEARVVAGGSINLTNLSGKNTLRFEAQSRKFSVNDLEIKQPGTQNIGVFPSYDVSGYVKAKMGHAIANVRVVNGGNSCITDENGYYSFSDVAGTVYVDNEHISRDPQDITHSGEYNFEISNSEFAFMLYGNANKNLDNASSVQIIGDGSVFGDTNIKDTTQYVHSVFKRDQYGNIAKQNINNGEVVKMVISVDPNVSLAIIGTKTEGGMNWEYQDLRGIDNVTSSTSAKHTTGGLVSTSSSFIKSTYGSYPDAYSSYVINSSTASISSITFDDASQMYTVVIRSSMAMQGGYQQQILKLAPSGTSYKADDNASSFCELTVQISRSGWIKQVDAHDEYKIRQTMDTLVTVTSDVKYTYHTDKPNYHINTITRDNVNGSLELSQQTEASLFSFKKYDVVSKTIYGI